MPNRQTTGSSELPRGLFLALVLVALPLLAVVALQIYQGANRAPQLALDRSRITRAFKVINATQSLLSAAQHVESAQRGFLLTSAATYLEAYQVQTSKVLSLFTRLRQLISDTQAGRMPVLEAALKKWLAERQQTMDVYDQGGLAAAQRLIRSREEIDTLRNVDDILVTTIARERELLSQRQTRAAQDEARISQVATATGAVALAVLGVGMWLTVMAFRRQQYLQRDRLEVEQRLGERLLQTQAALAQTQKMEALGQLTGGVAHDFNNLLHVINNAVTILWQLLGNENRNVTHYLKMITRNTDRAASTTSRLLAFARRQPLDPKPTDINTLLSGAAEFLRSSLGETVSLEVMLGTGLWSVAVDKNQLETAILNLALNARDAMPAGGKLTIESSNAHLDESYVRMHSDVIPGQYAMVAVSDTGVGMTSEVVSRAFEPFFTTKALERGTGLGLSQVFGFVKQSGGHINIYSEPGQGTTVKMYFPRIFDAAMEKPSQMPVPQTGDSGQSILVVEDNDDVRAFTGEVLSGLGYRVMVAPDGKLALNVLEEVSGADLLFTDIGLPGGMNGRELADEARRRWPQLKVLYTTGYAKNAVIHHGRLDTGVELITKPFTQPMLIAKVREVLGQDSRL